jgi:hypothetical protein
VLSIWTERRTTAQMCQEVDISLAAFCQWQNLAIEGMLKALDPEKKDPLPLLNHWLSRLNEKKLADALVVPINSQVNTASYNGVIEHTQGEFKTYLRHWGGMTETDPELVLLTETAAHDFNNRPRHSLNGLNACRAYFGGRRLRYSKRQRQGVYRWIRDLAVAISTGAVKDTISPAAWRAAARKWLAKNGMIIIQRAGKVLPDFL